MKCPACDGELQERDVNGVKVDVCDGGCGGVWFDSFELKKFDEPGEEAGEDILAVNRNPDLHVDHTARRGCPKCDGIVMMRHFFSVKKEVEVDECPGCGGFWIDFGELPKIRSQYETEEQREAAAGEYFDDLFGGKLAAMRSESQDQLQRARRIAGVFKWVCPTRYIPGKQAWGAF